MTKDLKRTAFVVLAILLLVSGQGLYYAGEASAFDGFAGGSGIEDDPYLVETAEHLNNVRNHLDAHFKQVADIDLSVYSEAGGWEPIGFFNPWGSSKKFTGTFDGNGFLISNLTIDHTDDRLVIGLFEYLGNNATLKNISLRKVKITSDEGAAGLVGVSGAPFSEKKRISRKSHSEDVTGVADENGNAFPDNKPIITNCSVKGNIIGEGAATGGLVVGNHGHIKGSHFAGEINGEGNVGGLVGVNEKGKITNSYAEGKVEGKENVGGLLGVNEGNVTDSYFTGIVASESSAGGLVGQNKGKVEDSYVVSGYVIGKKVIGGLLGVNRGEINNSYSVCQVAGEKVGGGLIGRDKGEVISCYYDKEIADRNDTGKGRPKATEEMTRRDTFVDWDFEETWSIAEGESYPYLQWAENDLPIPPEKKYHLLIKIWGNGETAPDVGFHLYPVEGNVEVTASPGENWEFSHWELNEEPAGEEPSIIVEAAGQGEMLTLVAYFDGFAEGAGTEEDPYQVETAEQLDNVRYLLESSYKQIADIDLGDYSEEKGWEPIGDGNNGFEGTFDGNGHEITNLTIKRVGADNVGLFGTLGEGKTLIKNVSLKNVDVTGNRNAGGLVGNNRSSKIKISNCNVAGNIRGKSSIGALLGTNRGKVNRIYASGTVTGELKVGGLIGMNRGNLGESYADVDVKGKRYVGGIAGQNRGVIKNSYTAGTVMGEAAVGGLVGKWINPSYLPQYLNDISRCFVAGKVEGEENTGGLIGEVHKREKDVKSCYYDRESTGQRDSTAGSLSKSTEEMMQEATFEDWDFEDVWAIDEEENYPYLQWQINETDQ